MSQTGTIGIVGGGQLGRMLTEAARELGYEVVVLDPGTNCPAVQVGAQQIAGDLYDPAGLKALAEKSDYLTVEIEHLDAELLEEIAASGKAVNPAPQTIRLLQDKLGQKDFLQKAGLPLAEYKEVSDLASAKQALDSFEGKMVLKSRHGAYDGRGNAVISSDSELATAIDSLGDKLYAERFIAFKKELAVMVARDMQGNITTYPVTETIHARNICIETITPAEVNSQIAEQATQVATKVAERLQGAGVFGIELFLTDQDDVLINEVAPRVHNSGHYTIEGCETSQFKQHILAITGQPLESTALKVPAAAMINLLGERTGPIQVSGVAEAQAIPGVAVHIYGKSPTKIDRKMGHITATGPTVNEARTNAEHAKKLINV